MISYLQIHSTFISSNKQKNIFALDDALHKLPHIFAALFATLNVRGCVIPVKGRVMIFFLFYQVPLER